MPLALLRIRNIQIPESQGRLTRHCPLKLEESLFLWPETYSDVLEHHVVPATQVLDQICSGNREAIG